MPETAPNHAIIASRLFDGEQWLDDQCILVRGAEIDSVIPADQAPGDLPIHHCSDGFVCPGLIDLQVNGGGGIQLNNTPTSQAVVDIFSAHRERGTTSILPTLISDTPGQERLAIAAVRECRGTSTTEILGLHLEGPYLSPGRRGTHMEAMIRQMSEQDVARLTAIKEPPLVVTLAPETVDLEQISALSASGIRVCAGHSAAGYALTCAAVERGISGFTHLFNAMSGLTGREPGVVGAALDADQAWVGIIVDGYHVAPANVRIAARAKPQGKLFLVSDAMSPAGSANPTMTLYGETIRVNAGRLVNGEGRLAGSAITLSDAVRICHERVGLPLAEALRMASIYPAEFMGLGNRLGRIASGYRANLAHFQADLQAASTWIAGRRQPCTGGAIS